MAIFPKMFYILHVLHSKDDSTYVSTDSYQNPVFPIQQKLSLFFSVSSSNKKIEGLCNTFPCSKDWLKKLCAWIFEQSG